MRFVEQPADVLKAGASLFYDYVEDFGRVAAFFQYDPLREESLVTRAARLDEEGPPPQRRQEVAATLAAYNTTLGASPATLAAIEQMGRGEALAVVAGQQAGLLTGPLYTIYKAVTAILLARRAAAILGRPVVPIFWVAGEDHDYDEVRALRFLDVDGALRELSLRRRPGLVRSVGQMPMPREVPEVLDGLVELAGRNEAGQWPHTREVAGFLQETAVASCGPGDWFARILVRLFSAHGLILVDPLLPGLRQSLSGFFRQALASQPRVAAGLSVGAARLAAGGYAVAFPPEEGQTGLFIYHKEQRIRIVARDGYLTGRQGQVRLSLSEALALAEGEPTRFSPAACLRPMAQDWLLPTLAQVAGPGEVSYLAQLGALYPVFGLTMPVFQPRLRLTLMTPEAEEVVARYGLTLEEAAGGMEERLARELERLDAIGMESLFTAARSRITTDHAQLMAALAPLGEGYQHVGRGSLERILLQMDYLEKKAWQHHKRRCRRVVRALRLGANCLYPGGAPQDTVLNVVPWLFRWGWGLIDGLLEAPLTPRHQMAYWT